MTYAQEATAEPRASAGTNVIAGILAYLQDRRLQPGDRLPSERDLAERLGVGRNAVREALATLVTLRVVESRPNSGVYLRHMSRESSFEALVLLTDIGATPTPTEVTETMEVRAHLELLAVSLACQRRTDEDLARMEAILARTDQTLEAGGNIAEMDTDFHIAVVDAAHNSVLVRTLNAFYRFTARRREVLFADHTQGLASAREHRQMLEHISNRDISKAERLILQHMDRATTYWSSYLET
ncbi:FadR/GntR family transcriptional regulator [Cupriavidus metallidurans]|uniref:Transcriptional regulator, GntR family n=1 Tax=Cupriavidus metallidurans (strain ATCC 43123 / DSM 2839 / NBRC 102507 / CH34) TaxID=266264 RepID=Q1LBR7_CUPMC|nr:FadR/GntR family transcriptional regulator [Cupriavidus metallidurans]ABF12409.1 putative transcriptional regulator, GntR family [Cupriavidus metallidurans CH34]QGS32364.1 FCD domain-containing protein [Cupriavidus metallidurans]